MTIDVMRLIGNEIRLIKSEELKELATKLNGFLVIEGSSVVVGLFRTFTSRRPELSVSEQPGIPYGFIEVHGEYVNKFFEIEHRPDLIFRIDDMTESVMEALPNLKNVSILDRAYTSLFHIMFRPTVNETKKKIKL